MKSQRASEFYQQTAVETADQKTLIVLCYDEAIKALQAGKECFFEKAFEKKAREFERAQALIAELDSSLNMEAGGQIARNLRSIYHFMLQHIVTGDVRRNMKAIDEVVSMLSELRSAWAQIDTRPVAREAMPSVSPQARFTGIAV